MEAGEHAAQDRSPLTQQSPCDGWLADTIQVAAKHQRSAAQHESSGLWTPSEAIPEARECR